MEKQRGIPRAAIGPVLFISLLILLFFGYRPPARPEIAPPWAVSDLFPFEWSPGMEKPRPTPAPVTGNSYQRVKLNLTTSEGLYSEEEQVTLANEVEAALTYVSQRFAGGAADDIDVYVGNEQGCNLNGLAYTEQRLVQVFTCAELPRRRAINILAHEFVHQLCHDRYGADHLQADLILSEGIATWGAGKYWLGDYATFKDFVHEHYQQNDRLIPLPTSYVGRPIQDMNTLYYEWASFVEFLLERYGREKFDALYVSGSLEPGSADYTGIYDKALSTLEQEWKTWLNT